MTHTLTGMPEGLKIGDHVPDFTLQAGMGENHTLSDYQQRGTSCWCFTSSTSPAAASPS